MVLRGSRAHRGRFRLLPGRRDPDDRHAPPDRGGRHDHPLELPGGDGDPQDRPGPGRRVHGGAPSCVPHAPDSGGTGTSDPAGRRARGRGEHRALEPFRGGLDDVARGLPGPSRLLHRFHPGRSCAHEAGGGEGPGVVHGARGQRTLRGGGRRRYRRRGDGCRSGQAPRRGRSLHGRQPLLRPPRRRPGVHREVLRRRPRPEGGAGPGGRGEPDRPPGDTGCPRQDQRPGGRGGGRGRRRPRRVLLAPGVSGVVRPGAGPDECRPRRGDRAHRDLRPRRPDRHLGRRGRAADVDQRYGLRAVGLRLLPRPRVGAAPGRAHGGWDGRCQPWARIRSRRPLRGCQAVRYRA